MSIKKTGSVLGWLKKLLLQAAWKRLKKLIARIIKALEKVK